jgi:hypothetical protein
MLTVTTQISGLGIYEYYVLCIGQPSYLINIFLNSDIFYLQIV